MLGRCVLRCGNQLTPRVNVCTRGLTVKPIKDQFPNHLACTVQSVRGVRKHAFKKPSEPFTCSQKELDKMSLPAAINPPGERYIGTLLINVRCSQQAVLNSYCMFAQYSAEQLDMKHEITPGKITRSVITVNRSPHVHGAHKDRFTRDLFNSHIIIKDVSGSTADVYVEYLQRHMTEGMSMSVTEERLVEISDEFLNTFYSDTNREMSKDAELVNMMNNEKKKEDRKLWVKEREMRREVRTQKKMARRDRPRPQIDQEGSD